MQPRPLATLYGALRGLFQLPGLTDAQGQQSPAAYTYSSAGEFDAAVRVTDNEDLSATAELSVSVNIAPQISIEADVTSGDDPLAVTFTAIAL